MPTIKISGMSCGHCVSSVTKALNEIDGIKNVEVSLEKKEARYEEEKPVDRDLIKKAVAAIGFTAE